ncbi:MAG: hypothetical protein M3Q45_00580 [Chloroflexota bacterium]|nr:hypothetical protein [Chloroflexota bacterium]
MDIALKIEHPKFAVAEVRNTIAYVLRTETEQVRLRRDYYADVCASFEKEHNLSSDQFLIQFEQGTMGDDLYTFDWFAAKRGLDLWEQRYQILRGVSL